MFNTGPATIVFLVSMIIFIIVMITFIIIILFFVQKKQRGFTNELIIVKANFEKELLKAQQEIQEQTLKEISREIHDNVLQMLSLARLGLGTWNLDKKEDERNGVSEISDILETAQDDLRHLSRMMNSEVICNGRLIRSVETQVGYIKRGGNYLIHLKVEGEPISKNDKKDIILFRIIQEALNNIIRHAAASEIAILLHSDGQFLKIQISDNGRGLELSELYSGLKTMNGIHNMEQRAKLINAKFLIESHPGKGTQITITTQY